MNVSVIISVLILVVCIVIFLPRTPNTSNAQLNGSFPESFAYSNLSQREELNLLQHLFDIKLKHPIIIKNSSLISNWPALSSWKDLKYLQKHLSPIKTLNYCKNGTIPLFVLQNFQFSESLPRTYQLQNLSISEFFSHSTFTNQSEFSSFYYYSGKIDQWSETLRWETTPFYQFQLSLDYLSNQYFSHHHHNPSHPTHHYHTHPYIQPPTSPHRHFEYDHNKPIDVLKDVEEVINDYEFLANPFRYNRNMDNEEKEEIMTERVIWMGDKFVTANTHYDRSHNFFIQIVGKKQWCLFPPTDYLSMYLYPSFHPSYHQSQIGDIHEYDSQKELHYPLFSRNSGFNVLVEPGDILYIPPFWFHEVKALDFGVSMSILNPSVEEMLISNAMNHLLSPFQLHGSEHSHHFSLNFWELSRENRYLIVRNFLVSFFGIMYDTPAPDNALYYITQFAKSQISHSQRISILLLNNRLINYTPSVHFEDCLSFIQSALSRHEEYFSKDDITEEEWYSFENSVEGVITHAVHFLRQLPPGIQEITITDAIEDITSSVFADDEIYNFLELCFV